MDASALRAWASSPRRLGQLGVALLALAAVGLMSVSPVVRWLLGRRAERLGVTIEVERVRPAFFGVRLGGVDIRPNGAEARVTLDDVFVKPSWSLGIGRVEVHGGVVLLTGDLDDLRKRWSPKVSDGAPRAEEAPPFPVFVEGVSLRWQRFDGTEGGTFDAWGLGYERDADGERVNGDLIRVELGGNGAELQGLEAELRRRGPKRILSRVNAHGVTAHVDLDGKMLATLTARDDGFRSSGAPVVAALPDARRGALLRAKLGSMARLAGSAIEPGGTVDLSGVRAEVRSGGELLNIGPARLSLGRTAGGVDLRLVPGTGVPGSALTVALGVPLGEGVVTLEVAGAPVSLAALGVREGDMGLVDVRSTRLDARGRIVLAADGATLDFDGHWALDGFSIQHEALATEVVRGLQIGGSGRGSLTLDGSRVTVREAELTVGRVKAQVSADITRGEGDASGRLEARVPLAACQDLFDATPRALLPDLAGMTFSGHFSFEGHVVFDTRRPADIDVTWRVENGCRITAVPAAVHLSKFDRPWRRLIEDGGETPVELEIGPGTPNWVPAYAISPHLETAVTVCEDARFRNHGGFDEQAIADSIRQNVVAGRFVRGASTVSMQLAKNLYLDRDKRLSRKLTEAVLTLLLEQELTKDEILELYLNVIEFGPGIYGIGAAAKHYFGVSAEDLSLAQSLYLGSILPSPKRQHFDQDGRLSEKWTEYLHRLMRIAHKIHRVTDEELEVGLAEEIRFGAPAAAINGDAEDPGDPTGSAPAELLELLPPGSSR